MIHIYLTKGEKSSLQEFLTSLLSSEYGYTAEGNAVNLTKGNFLLDNNKVFFNATHSKDNIAVAFSSKEIGIDAEVVDNAKKLTKVFGVNPKNAEEYSRLFTTAEALVKLYADVKKMDLRKIDLSGEPLYDGEKLDANLFTFIDDGVVYTVASTEKDYVVKRV